MEQTVLERASALARDLDGRRAEHDARRQLDPAVVASLRETGILGALAPRELGGLELAPSEYLAMLEALAIGDSATAW